MGQEICCKGKLSSGDLDGLMSALWESTSVYYGWEMIEEIVNGQKLGMKQISSLQSCSAEVVARQTERCAVLYKGNVVAGSLENGYK